MADEDIEEELVDLELNIAAPRLMRSDAVQKLHDTVDTVSIPTNGVCIRANSIADAVTKVKEQHIEALWTNVSTTMLLNYSRFIDRTRDVVVSKTPCIIISKTEDPWLLEGYIDSALQQTLKSYATAELRKANIDLPPYWCNIITWLLVQKYHHDVMDVNRLKRTPVDADVYAKLEKIWACYDTPEEFLSAHMNNVCSSLAKMRALAALPEKVLKNDIPFALVGTRLYNTEVASANLSNLINNDKNLIHSYNKSILKDICEKLPEHFAIAGGAIVNKLVGHEKTDVDLFIISETKPNNIEFLEERSKSTYHRTPLAVTNENYKVQMIRKIFNTPEELLEAIDISACKMCIYRGKFYCHPSAEEALRTGTVTVDYNQIGPLHFSRLEKYAKKGFKIYMPGLRISNDVNTPMFRMYYRRGIQSKQILMMYGGYGACAVKKVNVEHSECGLPYRVYDSTSLGGYNKLLRKVHEVTPIRGWVDNGSEFYIESGFDNVLAVKISIPPVLYLGEHMTGKYNYADQYTLAQNLLKEALAVNSTENIKDTLMKDVYDYTKMSPHHVYYRIQYTATILPLIGGYKSHTISDIGVIVIQSTNTLLTTNGILFLNSLGLAKSFPWLLLVSVEEFHTSLCEVAV